MSAALAYKDDWTEAAQPEPPRDRPRPYLAYSCNEKSNNKKSNTTDGDTRKKGQALDFGNGWSVGYQNLQVRKNMVLGQDWNITTNAMQFQICLRPGRTHKIAITLPTGQIERFTATNATDCATAQIPAPNIQFNAQPGTTSTLVAAAVPPDLIVQGGQLYDPSTYGPWNPTDYILTTGDGYTYNLSEGVGITRIRDPYGNTLTYGANGIIHSNGQSVAFTRDAQNRITGITDPLGKTVRYTYDVNGNLASSTDRTNQTSTYGYNRDHGLTSYTDPAGTLLARYTYDDKGRLIAATDADGKAIQTNHDTANNRETVTDRLGRTTTYTYDAKPNGETESWQYDRIGNRLSHTDFLGKKTSYTNDISGRVIYATAPDGGNTGYTYTQSGQIATTTDKRGTTQYGYDAQDRITIQYNPDGSYLTYAYDAAGNVIQRSTPAGTAIYGYDTLNRLTAVTGFDGKQTGYSYDANGNRAKTTNSNGTETGYTYDALNRLTGIEHRTTATAAILRGYAYTLKPNGQRTQIREYDATGTLRTRAYTYDALNRLTQDLFADLKTPASSKTTAYTYDTTGNRATKTETQGGATTSTAYSYDTDDRLTQETKTQGTTTATITYSWDANCNLIQKVEPTQSTLYAWDSNNRLVEVKRGTTAATATSVATYQYDANGNRVGKTTAAGQTIVYLVDSNQPYAQVAEEKATANGVTSTTDYLYGLERIQQTRAGQGTYYHDDGLGSTRILTDATGNVTDRYDYDDYGALQTQTGTTKNDFMYAGEQFDTEANLYYNRARYLDTNTGRFTGLDPFAGSPNRPITLNKYTYVGGDPVNVRDPSGLMGLMDLGAASNIATTLGGVQANFGFSFMDAAMNPNDADPASNIINDVGFMLLGTVGKGARMVAAAFSKQKKFILGKGPSSTNLAHNIEVFSGGADGAKKGFQAHHIVPGNMRYAKDAQNILKKYHIDIDSPVNGIMLPKLVHDGRHFDDYAKFINERIVDAEAAGGKAGVYKELMILEDEIRNGLWDYLL